MSSGEDSSNGTGRRDKRRQALRPTIVEGEASELSAGEDTDREIGPEAAGIAPVAPDEAAAPDVTEALAADPQPSETTAGDPESGSATDAETGVEAPLAETASPPDPTAGEAPSPEPAVAAETTPLPTARRASLIAAGLVGALLALGGYFGLHYSGLLPTGPGADLGTVTANVEDIGRRIATVESSLSRAARRDSSKELGDRIAGVETAVKELGADPKNSLVRRLGDVEARIAEMAQAPENGPAAAAIDERLSAVESKLAGLGGAAGAVPADLDARLKDIESRVAAAEARPAVVSPDGKPVDDTALKQISDRIAALDARMKETAATVGELRSAGAAQSAERLGEIDAAISGMRGELDRLGQAVGAVSDDVGERLAAFEKSIESRDTSELRGMARTTAGALAVTALQKAADGGAPYQTELDALGPLLDGQTDLSVLEAHAATGVPDLAALQAQFAAAADAILTAGGPQQKGMVGSILASARSLVRVRPTGQVEGEGRGPAVARIEAALEAGDLKTAVAEWETLDAEAKAASQAWASDLEARIAVNEALARVSTALTASLTGTVKN